MFVGDFDCRPEHKKCCDCPTPPPTGATLQVNLTAFVDERFGNDGTAELTFANKPYETIEAALAAVLDAGEDDGWVVRVRPGTYALSQTLKPSGNVKFFFEAGAKVTSNVGPMFAPGEGSTRVEGFGDFDAATGPIAQINTANATFALQGDTFLGTGTTALVEVNAACTLTLKGTSWKAMGSETAILNVTNGLAAITLNASSVETDAELLIVGAAASGSLSANVTAIASISASNTSALFEVLSNMFAVNLTSQTLWFTSLDYVVRVEATPVAEDAIATSLNFTFGSVTVQRGCLVFSRNADASAAVNVSRLPIVGFQAQEIVVNQDSSAINDNALVSAEDTLINMSYNNLIATQATVAPIMYTAFRAANISVRSANTAMQTPNANSGFMFNVQGIAGSIDFQTQLNFYGEIVFCETAFVSVQNGALAHFDMQFSVASSIEDTPVITCVDGSLSIVGAGDVLWTQESETQPCIDILGILSASFTLDLGNAVITATNFANAIVFEGTAKGFVKVQQLELSSFEGEAILVKDTASLDFDVDIMENSEVADDPTTFLLSIQSTSGAKLRGIEWTGNNLCGCIAVVDPTGGNVAGTITFELGTISANSMNSALNLASAIGSAAGLNLQGTIGAINLGTNMTMRFVAGAMCTVALVISKLVATGETTAITHNNCNLDLIISDIDTQRQVGQFNTTSTSGNVRLTGNAVKVAGVPMQSINAFGVTTTATQPLTFSFDDVQLGRSVNAFSTNGSIAVDINKLSLITGSACTYTGNASGNSTFSVNRLTGTVSSSAFAVIGTANLTVKSALINITGICGTVSEAKCSLTMEVESCTVTTQGSSAFVAEDPDTLRQGGTLILNLTYATFFVVGSPGSPPAVITIDQGASATALFVASGKLWDCTGSSGVTFSLVSNNNTTIDINNVLTAGAPVLTQSQNTVNGGFLSYACDTTTVTNLNDSAVFTLEAPGATTSTIPTFRGFFNNTGTSAIFDCSDAPTANGIRLNGAYFLTQGTNVVLGSTTVNTAIYTCGAASNKPLDSNCTLTPPTNPLWQVDGTFA